MAQLSTLGDFAHESNNMKPFTRVLWIARTMRIIAIGWLVSGISCLLPETWIASFLDWVGLGPMPHAVIFLYVIRKFAYVTTACGVLFWVVATDVVRYRPIVITTIAIHLIFVPVLCWLDVTIGMPLWWCIMDWSSCLLAGGFLLAYWLWPSKTSPNKSRGCVKTPGGIDG